ncbi:MAG: acyl-CoA dehydrogenase, partial [Acidimicrobiaceae bacterium]|nr:acyl-CoA dehydrogenase [Acidimicrobiaceae bacterium]
MPGSIAGDLGKRAGDMVIGRTRGGAGGPGGLPGTAGLVLGLAKRLGRTNDPLIRQDLMRLHILSEIGRFTTMRQKAVRAQGGDIPGVGNIAKLSMSDILRLGRDVGLRLLGPRGALHAYDAEGAAGLNGLPGSELAPAMTDFALFAQGPSIYGGTDQIQRNIIGERVLGLPKEPNKDKTTPFKDLPRN